jgi:Carbohydrate binding module (family 6)/F5/8 type C domain/Right handed beta helix region
MKSVWISPLILAVIAWGASPSHAAVYNVSTSLGNDANSCTQATNSSSPKKTIQQGVNCTAAGDTVIVRDGTYAEEVTLTRAGVNIQAYTGERPVVDGGNTRLHGFYSPSSVSVSNVTIDGFEIKGQTRHGIFVQGGNKQNFQIRNNYINHLREKGIWVNGSGHLIEKNEVFMIGRTQESMGILVDQASNVLTQDNQTYFITKTGIRDFAGYNNTYRNNISYANAFGMDLNSTQGGVFAYNNYLYYNATIGLNAKHNTGKFGFNRFWHNTLYGNQNEGLTIGFGLPIHDYLDIRNNIFSRNGCTNLGEVPSQEGPDIVIDGNLYYRGGAQPMWARSTFGNVDCSRMSGQKTLLEIQQQTSREDNGKEFDPQLIDPEHGNPDYPSTSPAAKGSLTLSSPLGSQLGARGLVQTSPDFVLLPLTAIAASTNFSLAGNTTDNLSSTTWNSGSFNSNQWIVYDLGSSKTFRYFASIYCCGPQDGVNNFSIQVSNDNINYTTVYTANNQGTGYAVFHNHELPSAVTARYVKFLMIDNFPEDGNSWTLDNFNVAGVWIGNFVPKTASITPRFPPPSSPLAIPGRIEAEEFNTGGEGIAYHDTTSTNLGGAYRAGEAADTKLAPGGVGYTIGYIDAGEWLKYDVNVTQSGNYTVTVRGANGASTNGNFRIEVDGVNVTGTVTIPPTGSYSTETTVTGPTVSLTQGTHSLRLYMEASDFDLNWVEFSLSSVSSAPAAPGSLSVSVGP